ncbi:hypothetical protein [Nostoc sp.]|uniref:hypothetical protein n=1 Tax=Nostoc sp. TaxID=1180 RepID=UPI002FFCFEFA
MSKIRAVIVDPNVPGRLALSEVNTPKPALDYGYLQDTQSGDGNNIDVWIGSLLNQTVTAVICSVRKAGYRNQDTSGLYI